MFHSNSSPFNQRQPKIGPSAVASRFHQESSTSPVELPKRGNTPKASSSMLSSRPMITNSRVKQDEKYKRDMYLAYVNNALLQKSKVRLSYPDVDEAKALPKGNSEPFDELVSQFGGARMQSGVGDSSSTPATQLRQWVSALSHVVSQLERTHSALVEAVINMPWTAMDGGFVQAYVTFIGMLVSARPEYLTMVLEQTARGLTFRSGIHALDGSVPEGSSSPLTRRVVYERLHTLLQRLLSLIPTLPNTLQPLLVRNFPHKRQEKADQVTYIRNLLRITEYCPALADRILSTIIDRAIQIDVEIQVEMEEIEADNETRDDVGVFINDPFDTLIGQEGSDSDEEDDDVDDLSDLSSEAEGDPDNDESPAIETDIAHVRDMIAKLDVMLKLVFDHFHRTQSNLTATPYSSEHTQNPGVDIPSSPSPTRPSPLLDVSPERSRNLRRGQFLSLLSIFDRTILRTFKSRYTQFLVFWYASLDPQFTDMFQGLLVSRAFEITEPLVTRAVATSYIASFVSRAKFVDGAGARRVVGLLCEFLQNHLDVCAAAEEAINPLEAHHTMFYAVTQAVFLIFCFRWQDLQVDHEIDMDGLGIDAAVGKKWIPELNVMQRVVTSSLNPLKVCSQNVVQQFARVAQSTDFIYCYTILESNRRSDSQNSNTSTPRKSSTSVSAQTPVLLGDATDADLNTFFPFDPYKLPISYSYVQDIYREWSSVALDEDEEDEDEEEDDYAHEEAPEVQASSRQAWDIQGQDEDAAGALGTSFGGMSISPVQPTVPRSLAS